ncbi:hypothetical protein A0H81_05890 [Grifola frondosa]|uniref:Uncharacterized protein n=1 Tax=Grifola frondosa TaxID=5627 RepID=A0A1C7M9R2_GRIFR|nr:hypothetical protein A0H81_05890 [Grifola frondosa]
MGRITAADEVVIEQIAHNRNKFERIFEEQSAILRADPDGLREVHARISELPHHVIDANKLWPPTPENRDAYMTQVEEICNRPAVSLEDRLEITSAAHTALMCIVMVDMAQQPPHIRTAIVKRNAELARVFCEELRARPTSQPPETTEDEAFAALAQLQRRKASVSLPAS